MEPAGPLLSLTAGGRRLGVPARLVREVTRMPRLTPVPHAPAAMLGLANVRGAVLPVLSLARLSGDDAHTGDEKRLVVLAGDNPVALAVAGVSRLVDASDAAVEPIDVPALVAQATPASPKAGATAQAGAEPASAAAAERKVSLVTFAIGAQAFAFALDTVEEVLRLPAAIDAVPHAEPMVVGSVALRGALLPLLGLAELLALPGKPRSARTRVLVVRIGRQRVGLVVDAMHGIIRVDERAIDPLPLVLARGAAEARIQAVCRRDGGKLVSILAPEHLLRPDLTAQLAREPAAPAAATARTTDESAQPFLMLGIGETTFGLPLAAVEQIARVPGSLSRLPRAPAFVRGLMPLRGEVLPVIDQARRLGAAARDGARNSGRQRIVVVNLAGRRAGLLVDGVAAIRRVPTAAVAPLPAAGSPATRSLGHVATCGDEQLLLILDPAQVLDEAERDLLRAMALPAA